MRITSFISFVLAIVAWTHAADADVKWESKGWVKLGERAVDGRVDKDTIVVGKAEGTFTKLTMLVDKSDLDLLDFEITFGNGEKHNPKIKHVFKEGSRTRVLDLPGNERMIKSIELKYKNIAGGGKAHVEIWGWQTEAGALGAGKPSAALWDHAGWTKLGSRTVGGRIDKDRIKVARVKGKFEKMTIVVLDSDLDLIDFEVKFGRGPVWNPAVKHVFKEGQRTRVLDFPGGDRVIKYIDMKYANLPGGGKARVEVWAK